MAFEQRVAQLQQTNRTLTEEMIRVRNGALGLGRMYGSVSDGVDAVGDDEYFVVAGGGTYQRLYRRSGSSANFIAEYPSTDVTEQIIEDAKGSAEGRIAEATGRAEAYGPKLGFVSRERLRQEATLDLDFVAGEYRLEDGETLETTDASEILTVDRPSPKWAMGPNGRLREVPPDTLAREWRDGKCRGLLVEESRTNMMLGSSDPEEWSNVSGIEVEEGASGPIGGEPYIKLVYNGGSRCRWRMGSFDFEEGESYTLSFYIRDGFTIPRIVFTGSFVEFNVRLDDPSAGNTSGAYVVDTLVEEISEGRRVSVVFESTVTAQDNPYFVLTTNAGTSNINTPGSEGDFVEITGFQLEKGPTPTSYIPTEDAPVTRAEDDVRVAMGDYLNREAFTLMAIASSDTGTDTINPVFSVDNGFNSTGVQISNSSSGRVDTRYGRQDPTVVFSGTGDKSKPTPMAVSVDLRSKQGRGATLGRVKTASFDVENYVTDFSRGLYIGSGNRLAGAGARQQWDTNIQQAMIIPRFLSEEEMIALTTPEE